mmetsp:Transcript_27740/g.57087  ORF Transcript_27740/g.57087 Transcript_27740/m.57087 type:complete len:285 (-) Transcript_27740:29-883(-)
MMMNTLFTITIAAIHHGYCISAFTPSPQNKVVACRSGSPLCASLGGNRDHEEDPCPSANARREFLSKLFNGATSAAVVSTVMFSPEPASAFSNKISDKYDDRPKQRGAKPKGLGLGKRTDMGGEEYIGLKQCGAAPNCFCSTDPVEDYPDHSIPSWKYPADSISSKEDAFQQLYEVVKEYPPGQDNIDGGGFDIVTFDPKAGYMYVQFESLKNGFIDDVEFAVIDEKTNQVEVRSSSRLGYLDYGVNSRRLNYLAKALRVLGWDAPGVDLKTHRGYADENGLKF